MAVLQYSRCHDADGGKKILTIEEALRKTGFMNDLNRRIREVDRTSYINNEFFLKGEVDVAAGAKLSGFRFTQGRKGKAGTSSINTGNASPNNLDGSPYLHEANVNMQANVFYLGSRRYMLPDCWDLRF